MSEGARWQMPDTKRIDKYIEIMINGSGETKLRYKFLYGKKADQVKRGHPGNIRS